MLERSPAAAVSAAVGARVETPFEPIAVVKRWYEHKWKRGMRACSYLVPRHGRMAQVAQKFS